MKSTDQVLTPWNNSSEIDMLYIINNLAIIYQTTIYLITIRFQLMRLGSFQVSYVRYYGMLRAITASKTITLSELN